MPLRNRVTPLGELIADPARGLVYGNRGCLHDRNGNIVRRFQVKRWIACRLEFKGRRRVDKLQPGRYTELFFLDEATAFAAGHRPCAECRRDDYNRFMQILGESRADAVERAIAHGATRAAPPYGGWRTARRGVRAARRRALAGPRRRAPSLEPVRVLGKARRSPAEPEAATVVTPPSLLDVLRHGFTGVVPLLHPSARCR